MVVSGSRLGTLTFHGADGTSFIEAATVAGEVDGVRDKQRIIAKHNANVQNLIKLFLNLLIIIIQPIIIL